MNIRPFEHHKIKNAFELLEQICRDMGDHDIQAAGKRSSKSYGYDHKWVHFIDDDGEDIGHLPPGMAMTSLIDDIYLWPDCGPDYEEEGCTYKADMDLREAVSVRIETH